MGTYGSGGPLGGSQSPDPRQLSRALTNLLANAIRIPRRAAACRGGRREDEDALLASRWLRRHPRKPNCRVCRPCLARHDARSPAPAPAPALAGDRGVAS